MFKLVKNLRLCGSAINNFKSCGKIAITVNHQPIRCYENRFNSIPAHLLKIKAIPYSITKENLSQEAECDEHLQNVDDLFSMVHLKLKGHDIAVLKSYQTFIEMVSKNLDLTIKESKILEKPTFHRFTTLRSIHLHKKNLIQYEVRTHFMNIKLINMTGSTLSTFLEYIQRNLPNGIFMEASTTRIEQFNEAICQSLESCNINTVN
ncbi:hypothetical protein A3Q56_01648 [Intoshia linei]|uniref:Small ribosomal subunit protein uS10m n=1 Tax=Intoshia linei TaxID=1819745 RepID=A0A177B8R9_9BILA|nr:hypothetical protein A3Q56_01648 [Intoshia linei]